jgi:NAD(P)H-flavin reductase
MKSNSKENGVPMIFDKDNDGNMSWGVCTLSAKKKLGRSNYMKYDFKLPKAENILNLALGQKVSLCCLDNDNKVAKKDYYLFTPKNGKGSFSILSSIDGSEEEDNLKLTSGEGDFSKVLSEELDIGDEIALQPGPRTLSYRGEYLPVTDMLYIASGSGIAPVLDQVKAVLPSGSSSVKSVSVIWRNDNEEDFDVALSSLEDEYFKYSTKLAVSCVVDEEKGRRLDQNSEIEEALPSFEPGTMAVVAGPRQFSNEARAMLVGYGYPEECICVLP